MLRRALEHLEQDRPLRGIPFSPEEEKTLRGFTFLSLKPLLLVVNAGEGDVSLLAEGPEAFGLAKAASRPGVDVVALSAQIESEIANLDEWGSQRLAYPIRKLNEGYYLIYRLKLALDTPKQIEAALRQRDNVMRVLVVKDRPEWRTLKKKPAAEATPAAS